MTGKLSVVATPIGNLEDITLRALRILKEADYVACEDTRQTRKLLSHFDIHTPAVSDSKVLGLLAQGKHIALVSDAGTPNVSDPGGELVAKVRAQGAQIETIPGPSALVAALSIAGIKAPSFTFYGFLPQKKGREKLFKDIATSDRASIFFESPHRIMKALEALTKAAPSRRIGLYRELTKIYEEALIGTAEELYARLEQDPQKQRGEFVVIVESM
ncbi:16S rRNA (cytidine(1402)-2'-O)-methyltransferase [Candidatus Adlerbacteria bacterium RIFCSPHIGHO2_02_FULL_54_18]|uniref:Ribosomal RNA small subunit methyltransferase I n=2 Tax=Candidatus Adleribacteriota TaxID=1752736 RepID=A0A1F4Y3Z2_9BACT|nr:MAG: 16S rRNA (cytidine(1402)-2'-O)-methyltransferase [Candidatus Adlerbacteria bacterium RIFCSPLOWO2_01_FULL_54_21b]OGC88695.1 MAG: 16S rRNA (cytidine(1402)-2'-O)-methyltransferase [Candidatus Adlerbacteria bacterium RIFCSPHIGHO2_02_FULL_54_18]